MKTHPWFYLVIVLLLCAPPLFVHVGHPSPTRIMETLSFLSSQETWLRMHQGEPTAWKMPTWNGRPRVEKPPLLVWMNLMAWQGLDPSTASVDDLVLRSRLLSATLALMAIASVFWIGITLDGSRLAILAALATGSSLFFIRQGRYASYDTHIAGWTTMAVAAGLWAVRAPPAQTIRMWMAWITTLLAPWFVIASARIPEAAERFQREYVYIFEMFKNPLAYLVLFPLVFPWTLWLAAGASIPVVNREKRRDHPLFFSWCWMVSLLLLLSLAPVKNKRYLVPLLPSAGLLTAYAWRMLQQQVTHMRTPGWIRWFGRIHWGLLMIAPLPAAAFLVLQPRLVSAGVLDHVQLVGIPSFVAVFGAALLMTMAVTGWKAHAAARLYRSAILTALWMLGAATLGYYGYAAADHELWPHRTEAERLSHRAVPGQIHYISQFHYPHHEAMPSHEFLIYYRGVIPAITTEEIHDRIQHPDSFLLMTRLPPEDESALEIMGLRYLFDLCDGRAPDWKVWTHDAAGH